MFACGGTSVVFTAVTDSTLEYNTIQNAGNSNATVGSGNGAGDPTGSYQATGAGTFSDLPNYPAHPGDVALAFALLDPPSLLGQTEGNNIDDNQLIGNCASPWVGLGYFASRGTGLTAEDTWSDATLNYYEGNSPIGSNAGSVRDGFNWYAANNTAANGDNCTETSPPAACNTDDWQHQGAGNDWARNDEQYYY